MELPNNLISADAGSRAGGSAPPVPPEAHADLQSGLPLRDVEASQAGNAVAPVRQKVHGQRPRVDPALLDLDTQLMLAVREGDVDAANALVRRNFERLSRYLTRLVRSAGPAEDLTQDVFVQVFSHARDFEPRARFSTWMYRIATNRAVNFMKASQVRRQDNLPADRDAIRKPEAADSPERQMDIDELRRRVASAVERLPVNQRVALTLFEYESLSYEQIAGVLEVTVEAVRCLLTRARGKLREELAGLI